MLSNLSKSAKQVSEISEYIFLDFVCFYVFFGASLQVTNKTFSSLIH